MKEVSHELKKFHESEASWSKKVGPMCTLQLLGPDPHMVCIPVPC